MSAPGRPSPRPGLRQARLVRLGSVLGVPIFVTPSWLIIVAFVMLSYADFLHTEVNGLSSTGAYGLAFVFAIALAGSVLAHELGHTIVSRMLGLRVSRIVVFLLGGVSEIDGEPERPRHELAIAAAGPLVSLLLAAGAGGVATLLPTHSAAGVVVSLLAWSNLIIAVFNVLPGLPLDGGRLVQATVWMFGATRVRATVIAAWCGRVVAALLVVAVLASNAAASSGSSVSIATLGATAMGFAVCAFLWFGATQALRVATLSERAARISAERLVRRAVYLPEATPLSEALRHLTTEHAAAIVVIDSHGRTRALVEEDRVREIPADRRPWYSLSQVSRQLEPGLILSDALAGDDLLAAVRATPASEYLVVGPDGVSRGLLATTDLARALGLTQGAARR